MFAKWLVLFLITISLNAQMAKAQDAGTAYVYYLLCKNGSAVRSISVEPKKGGGCFVKYTKAGVDQQVGESWGNTGCIKIAGNIQKNIETGGWKCKEAKGELHTPDKPAPEKKSAKKSEEKAVEKTAAESKQ